MRTRLAASMTYLLAWVDRELAKAPSPEKGDSGDRGQGSTSGAAAGGYDGRMERLGHPGWCENLIKAGRLLPGERVLVVVDEPLAAEGAQLAAAVKDADGEPHLELWVGERPLAAAPAKVLEAARTTDLSFFLSEAPRADEAGPRFQLLEAVTGHGGRQIFMGLVDSTLLNGELSEPPNDVSAAARQLLRELDGCETIRIRGRAGTDLTLEIGGRPWKTDATELEPGEAANYPGGEIFIAPHSDGAEGVLVADLTVPYTVEGLVDEPVTLRFEAGRVTSIEGGRAADMLRALVDRAGPGGNVIAELGIGLNHAVRPRGHVMLDEKAGGTAHVAIGRNSGPYGGDNHAAIHVDCIFSGPELEADGRSIPIP
jgi:leucyl aminopeptidase (aminopeptidase T)